MVSLQHFVQIIMVAQLSSYWYRMNACVQATSVHTTAILYHFHRTWWIICTLKISYVTVFTHILIQRNYRCLGSHWCPLQALCHYGHWCLLQVLCHDGHCCPMLTLYLEPWWSLGSMQTMCLVPWWSLLYSADPLSCTMLVTSVHCKPLPRDLAVTSVCSATFRRTNFHFIAACQMVAHNRRAHAY